MNIELEKYLTLLEQRLSLLRALAQQLTGCRKEFMAMDLDGMYCRIADQEELCRQIQALHPAIESLQRTCARQLDLRRFDTASNPDEIAWAARLRDVMLELGETQTEVRRLNQIHGAYLRRTRRTLSMMMNFLGSYAYSYSSPTGPIPLAPRMEERG